ncbi:MAG TPA: hypothetical protein VMT57_04235 [Candidatus Thermoplasmatota archaeon]|nr:hypothetical protein [Candidatus Thermoplasmatota archaeon]
MKKGTISRSCNCQEEAVSEIVSTLILVTIAVSMFSAIALEVLNPWINYSDETPTNVFLVGFIAHNDVVIEHRGGVPLSPQTKVTMIIDGARFNFMVNQFNYWVDENNDGEWSIGEQVVYPIPVGISDPNVTCIVVDSKKNSVIFDKTLQIITTMMNPYTQVLAPTDVTETSATIKMFYNFINVSNFASGNLKFTYGLSGGPYTNSTTVTPLAINGFYGLLLNGLSSGTQYEYWARMNYPGGSFLDGPLRFFTYQAVRGLWHLDEPAGSPLAHDAINPTSNGTVQTATFTGIGGTGEINGSLMLKGDSDLVDVPHHPKFNITDTMYVESWLNVSKTGVEFPGKISEISANNVSDILGINCFEPDLIQIDSTLYAVAYHDDVSAYVTTFRMTDNGVFQGVVDTKPIIVPHINEPHIIQIRNDIYAVIYGAVDSQTGADNHIVTMAIYQNGTISNSIDSFSFPEYYGRSSDILNIGSNIYALSFGGTTSQVLPTGYLVTIRIDALGSIGPGVIDTFKFNDTYCSETSLVRVANGIYAITYNGYGATAGMGYIITVKILSNGSIITPLVDTYQFGVTPGLEPAMTPVANNVYAIAYGADSNDQLKAGFLQTVSIDTFGQITNSSLDTLLLPVEYSFKINIIHVDNEIYALAFSGGNDSDYYQAYVLTVNITDTGNISDSVLSLYQYKTHFASDVSGISLFSASNELIVCYGSTSSEMNGFFTMEKISLTGTPKWIIHKGNAFGLQVSNDLIIGTMSIGNTTYSVSGTVSLDNWIKIDFTYGLGFLRLYINNVLQAGSSTPCTGAIQTNTNDLIIGGGMYGSLDEIKICRGVYVPP